MDQRMIKELKKGDRFKFNYGSYLVTRKFLDDNRPLIAIRESDNYKDRFDWEELEIELLPKFKQ